MVVELGGVKVWMGWVWRTYECSDENTGDDGWDGARAGVACDASTSGECCKDECGGFDGLLIPRSRHHTISLMHNGSSFLRTILILLFTRVMRGC